jgi:hypothetical protein
MKYLITESKLEKVVMKYLNGLDLKILDKITHIYFVRESHDDYAYVVYDIYNHKCIIYYDLIGEITSLFSLDSNYSEELIGKWVEDTLGMEVKSTGWMF